ncbi:MAG: cation diffusion facilitator family transporter, partial [Oscillospiraceae bacterium]|nr:cation diffusion facilitator family transporter [Oscillospiraceae bacterium]
AFLSFVIFFAGTQLIINVVSDLINDVHTVVPSALSIEVIIISIVGKALLALSQYMLGKKADSSLLKANAKNMLSDVVISVGVLIGFIVSSITGSGHVDSIFAILVGLWIIKTAFGIFTEVNLELMDGNNDATPYRAIIDAVDAVSGASNPHHARVRRISTFWDIEFDIDVNPNSTVLEAHQIATLVEANIKRQIENVFDIMIHIEPKGDISPETFGLSEDDMRSKTASSKTIDGEDAV